MTQKTRHKSQHESRDANWLAGLVKKMIELSEPAVQGSAADDISADDISLAAIRQQLARNPSARRQAA